MARRTLIDFFEDLSGISGEFLVFDDGYRTWSLTYRETTDRARAFAAQGFHGVKIKVGFDLDQDIDIVRAVRQELGKDFTVMTDANQGYSVDVGLKAAQAFSQCGVFWLEEPLFVEDIEGHAQLREKGKIPIAVGENLNTHYAFENFVVRGAVDFLQPDVARAGGITGIKKIALLAANHNVNRSEERRVGKVCRSRWWPYH